MGIIYCLRLGRVFRGVGRDTGGTFDREEI